MNRYRRNMLAQWSQYINVRNKIAIDSFSCY
jgi:hypothetical protein